MENPRPISEFNPRDRDVIKNIDAVLAGYCPPMPDLQLSFEDPEVDRSPLTRHGVPSSVLKIGTTALEVISDKLN